MAYSKIHINGNQVHHFHYDDNDEQLEAYNYDKRIIATFSMSKDQWKGIKKMSYAECWDELGSLFGDEEN